MLRAVPLPDPAPRNLVPDSPLWGVSATFLEILTTGFCPERDFKDIGKKSSKNMIFRPPSEHSIVENGIRKA